MKKVGAPQVQTVEEKLPDGSTHISFNYPEDWEEYQQKYRGQEETLLKAVDPIAYEVNQAFQEVSNGEDGIVDIVFKLSDRTLVSIEVKGKYGVHRIQTPKEALKKSHLFGNLTNSESVVR